MAHKKCVICNDPITNEQGTPYKQRYAHEKCFNIAMKTLQKDKSEKMDEAAKQKKRGKTAKPKAELKDGMSEDEYKEKQDYYNYIRSLTGNDELSAKIYALSEDYIKRYSFTFASMHRTLVYLHEIVEKELSGDVVGIIPYYHSEAKLHQESIGRVEEMNKETDTKDLYKQRTIKIKPKARQIKQINIESVGKDGVD